MTRARLVDSNHLATSARKGEQIRSVQMRLGNEGGMTVKGIGRRF
ncbi:hypothetical protein BRPE64_ACDS11300 [Caballeronia insecticola]|uniref:Uncharacterized protein n=1 Tax=Caballeronia insecticola TaxID=758793 RepID=R4WGH7_9BURK|nr:hypothetical protein BRPE64_ACDS11300 [Caballeronia insecticola]